MDSGLHGVPLSAARMAPRAVPSRDDTKSGIRAPLTLDESDFESSVSSKSRRNSIASSFCSESEGFVSGEDGYETASKSPNSNAHEADVLEETHFLKEYEVSRPNVVKPNGEIGNRNAYISSRPNGEGPGYFSWHAFVMPFVRDPGGDSDGSASSSSETGDKLAEGEEFGLRNSDSSPPEAAPVVVAGKTPLVRRLRVPVAKISMDSDDGSEDGGFSSDVSVPSTKIRRRASSAPKARLSEFGKGDEHSSGNGNAVDMEFVKEVVAGNCDLGSKNGKEHYCVDDAMKCDEAADMIQDKALNFCKVDLCVVDGKHNAKSGRELHEEFINSNEEIREIDVISDERKGEDTIDIRESTDLGSTSFMECLCKTVKLMEPEVDDLGCSSKDGEAPVDEKHCSRQEQNGDHVHSNVEVREIEVNSDGSTLVDLVDQREPNELGIISFDGSAADLGTVNLMEPDVAELGCSGSSGAAPLNDDVLKSSSAIPEADLVFNQDITIAELESESMQEIRSIHICVDIKEVSADHCPLFAESPEALSENMLVDISDGDANLKDACQSVFQGNLDWEAKNRAKDNEKSSRKVEDSTLHMDAMPKIAEIEREQSATSLSGGMALVHQLKEFGDQIVRDSNKGVGSVGGLNDGGIVINSASSAALKSATGSVSDHSTVELMSVEDIQKFSVANNSCYPSSMFHAARPVAEARSSNPFEPPLPNGEFEKALTETEKMKIEKIQQIRVNYLQFLHQLGCPPENSVASKVLRQLTNAEERISSQAVRLDSNKNTTIQLEGQKKDNLDFSMCILIIGKIGVGKSSTINSIFGEKKAAVDAFEPVTTHVKEIIATVDGVKIKVIDTPGLKSSIKDQSINRKVLLSIKRAMQKSPPDVILYVDRLDTTINDLNDLPVLRSVASCLGSSIWQKAVLALTHASSVPLEGQDGYPISYEAFVAWQSQFVQQLIHRSTGEFLMTNPGSMIPVTLVENNPIAGKNGLGETLHHHGESWRSQLLLLCYSMKTLSEVSSVVAVWIPLNIKKLFHIPPFHSMYLHPKLSNDRSGDSVDSDIGYENLPPLVPLQKSRASKPIRGRRTNFFEYDYLVKLLQMKQMRSFRDLSKVRNAAGSGSRSGGVMSGETWSLQTIPLSPQDVALSPSFDGGNPSFRYPFWDSESTMAELGCILEGKTGFTNCGKNKTAADASIGLLGEHTMLGLKVEDYIAVGKQLMLMPNGVIVTSQNDAAYGANVELCKRNMDNPTDWDQISLGLSVVKFRDDLTCRCSLQSQFCVGNSSRLKINASLNNKLKGQISVKASCSDPIQIVALSLLPVAKAIFKKVFFPQSIKD